MRKVDWGLTIVKLNRFFSHPLGILVGVVLMLLILFVFFAWNINHTQNVNNQATIQREEAVAELLEADQAVIKDMQDNTEEIIRNQEKQTRIMCILFKTNGGTGLTDMERRVVEDECDEVIRGFDSDDTQPESQSQSSAPEEQPKPPREAPPTQNNPRVAKPQSRPQPDHPKNKKDGLPGEKRGLGLVERILNGLIPGLLR